MKRLDWMRELREKHGWTFGKNTQPKPERVTVKKPEAKPEPAKEEK